MKTLHLYGYLYRKEYEDLILRSSDKKTLFRVASELREFGKEHGREEYDDVGLGAYHINLNNCNLKILATDKECSLEEAEGALVDRLYGGEVYAYLENIGYSEFTIIGIDIEELRIGGHDIIEELRSYEGKYVHIVLELVEG